MMYATVTMIDGKKVDFNIDMFFSSVTLEDGKTIITLTSGDNELKIICIEHKDNIFDNVYKVGC